MRIIFYLLKTSRLKFAIALLTSTLAGLSCTLIIGVLNQAIHGDIQDFSQLLLYFAILSTVFLTGSLFAEWTIIKTSQKVLSDLRIDLCKKILKTPLTQVEQIGQHRIYEILTGDVNRIMELMVKIPATVLAASVISGCMLYTAYLSPYLFLVTLGIVGMVFLINVGPLKIAQNFNRQERDSRDQLQKHFGGVIHGIKELLQNSLRKQQFATDYLEPTSEHVMAAGIRMNFIYRLVQRLGETWMLGAIGAMMFFFPYFPQFSTEMMAKYFVLILITFSPFLTIVTYIEKSGQAKASLRKIEQLGLQLEAEISEAPQPPFVDEPKINKLELKNICFTHRNAEEPFKIGPMSMTFEAGELVYIVGGNGSGKSTLAKVLSGLYAPDGGEIFWQGQPITAENEVEYRQLFSVIFADFYLFEWLPLQDPERVKNRIDQYLSWFQLHKKVSVDRGVFSTINLSTGQRKRLALVSAFLEDKPVYIFDEWAADQDPEFKKIFYEDILPQLKARNKIVIVITHDDRYFYLADRIIQLEDGQVKQASKTSEVDLSEMVLTK